MRRSLNHALAGFESRDARMGESALWLAILGRFCKFKPVGIEYLSILILIAVF